MNDNSCYPRTTDYISSYSGYYPTSYSCSPVGMTTITNPPPFQETHKQQIEPDKACMESKKSQGNKIITCLNNHLDEIQSALGKISQGIAKNDPLVALMFVDELVESAGKARKVCRAYAQTKLTRE